MASSANPSLCFCRAGGSTTVDLRPVDESPATRAATLGELRLSDARLRPHAGCREDGDRVPEAALCGTGGGALGRVRGRTITSMLTSSNADPMGMRRAAS